MSTTEEKVLKLEQELRQYSDGWISTFFKYMSKIYFVCWILSIFLFAMILYVFKPNIILYNNNFNLIKFIKWLIIFGSAGGIIIYTSIHS